MNPNDNLNQPNQVSNTPQDGVNSIASKDEVPMSIEKIETPEKPALEPVASTEPVTSIFNQNTNSEQISKDSLYNYQTNAINPNASVNIDDFRIDEEKKSNLSEISNLESSTITEKDSINQQTPSQETEINFNSNTTTVNPVSMKTTASLKVEPPVEEIANNNQNVSSSNPNTTMIAVLGSILALGLVTGAYFVFFRSNQSSTENNYVAGKFQTEKIVVTSNTNVKSLTEDEYKTTIKSYIDRYNNNIRNSKVKLATPNITVEQKLEVYMSYSTEILNIYTELQNLIVPTRFKDSHDKLTLSLYALNSLFDSLIIDAKNKTLTTANEKQLVDSVNKAEESTAKVFNEISNSQ
ncbi:MAG: hypothetical protein EBV07_00560 [Proteobacteria bacterium]|nr:hypothetical protein [Pseudomonadota bacterium]